MQSLIGVVLCGGESKRMGKDKGLLLKDDKPWAVLIAEKLRSTGLDVAVSINKKQQKAYSAIFPETPLIIDQLPIEGPLDGLLSIHRSFPDKDILLMACDLIDMDEKTLQILINSYSTNREHEYYVYQHSGFTQPFCAIYTAKGLTIVYKAFEENQLKKYSLHNRFESGDTLYLPVENEAVFKNYNKLE